MPAVSFRRFESEVLEIYDLLAPATRRKVAQVLREFRALPTRSTAEIKPVQIARWLKAHKGRSPATTKSLFGSFSAACSLGVESGYLPRNPCLPRKKWITVAALDADEADVGRHHSAEQITRVLRLLDNEAAAGGWAEARLRALTYLVAFTGMRKMEALGLEISNVDLPGRMVRLKSNRWRKLKTPKSGQPVPIPEALAPVLAGWLPRCASTIVFPTRRGSEPWTSGYKGTKPLDQLKAAGVRAGVVGLTFLSLRHSWATHAETLWGLSDPTIQRILRHTTIRTSKVHYRHPDEPNLRRAVAGLSFEASHAS